MEGAGGWTLPGTRVNGLQALGRAAGLVRPGAQYANVLLDRLGRADDQLSGILRLTELSHR